MRFHFSLRELEKEDYDCILNDTDVQLTLEYLGLDEEYKKDVTGAVVIVKDGDYEAVWLSESSRPYDISSTYYALPFYLDYEKNTNYELLPSYWKKENEYYQ
jgi:hypothetical protein